MSVGTMQLINAVLTAAIGAALIALGVFHARTGMLPRLTRYTTIAMIVLSVPVSVIGFAEGVGEFRGLPLTRPGNVFGTYWEPTGVMILGVLLDAVLWLLAAIFAFVRRIWAAAIYLFLASEGALYAVRVLLTHSAPLASAAGGIFFSTIPALALALLLLSLRRREGLWAAPRRRHPSAGA